jgi:hypothetical protein
VNNRVFLVINLWHNAAGGAAGGMSLFMLS